MSPDGVPLPVLILASGSPRRRELLGALGVAFEVRPTDVDETPGADEAPVDLVRRLAVDKAQAGLATARETDVVVLAADTLVAAHGEVLGKPVDARDATRMLGLLSGTRHPVHTAVVVAHRAGATAASMSVEVVTTWVTMRPLTAEEIAEYVATGDPMDKAGAYAIQEIGDRFVERIEGPFDNVVGLPMETARRLLVDAGVAVQP